MSTPEVYLDHAAATPLDPAVFERMRPYLTEHFANPASLYPAARVTRTALADARAEVADLLGAKKSEVLFTAGSTESINLAIQGVRRMHPDTTVVTAAIEHDAVLATVLAGDHRIVPVGSDGLVAVSEVKKAIWDDTALVSIAIANNEIGTIQPVAAIAKLVAQVRRDRHARGIRTPLYLHTDASQAAAYLDLHVSRLGVDLMTLSATKIYGPKQVGLLYVRTGTKLAPLIYGGGQERGLRAGTENVAGAVGLAEALRLAVASRETENQRLSALRDRLIEGIIAALPDSIINGSRSQRLPGNVNVTLPGAPGEDLVLYLAEEGIMAATGSACSASDEDPSHVLLAIGRTRHEADQSLRLTLGRGTADADIDSTLDVLPKVVARLRARP